MDKIVLWPGTSSIPLAMSMPKPEAQRKQSAQAGSSVWWLSSTDSQAI